VGPELAWTAKEKRKSLARARVRILDRLAPVSRYIDYAIQRPREFTYQYALRESNTLTSAKKFITKHKFPNDSDGVIGFFINPSICTVALG
jgi:hypothetical protein